MPKARVQCPRGSGKCIRNVESKTVNILFACGGTGGHLFPALAIADELRVLRPESRFLFVGTRSKIEARVVPSLGYAFRTIWISGFHRGVRVSNILVPLKILVSVVQSFFLMRSFRPDAVVGTGGYVSGPPLFAASLLGIPTVVHESNSFPGVTTRLLSRRATSVLIAFDATRKWLKKLDNVETVGTPTRKELGAATRKEGAAFFGLDSQKPTVLVFGGSLGAASINTAVSRIIGDLRAEGIQVIWQTGQSGYDEYRSSADPSHGVWVGSFIDAMDRAYAAADVVVCRAGATTIAELTGLGKPSILVPYPHAAKDHQVLNARALADAGAARMVYDRDLIARLKDEILRLLFDKQAQEQMRRAALGLGKPNAAGEIVRKILIAANG